MKSFSTLPSFDWGKGCNAHNLIRQSKNFIWIIILQTLQKAVHSEVLLLLLSASKMSGCPLTNEKKHKDISNQLYMEMSHESIYENEMKTTYGMPLMIVKVVNFAEGFRPWSLMRASLLRPVWSLR